VAESRKAMSGVTQGAPEAQGLPGAQGVPGAQPAPGDLPDQELVIAAALQDRARQHSGEAMRLQVVAVLVLAAVACWLVLLLGRIPYVGYIGIGLAIVVAMIAVPFLFGVVAVSPKIPWGSPVRGKCPSCGGRTLREDRALHWEGPGTGRTVDGIVTLCVSQGCGYAAVRKLRQWAADRA
jgi:hypothetical protein